MDHTTWKDPAIAANYLTGVRGAIPLAAEQIDVLLRLVEACEGPVARVLDLGCGDGVLGAAVLSRFEEARCRFVDFSDTMLEAARTKLAQFGERAIFSTADYSDSGWWDDAGIGGPLDVVVSGFSIHHQPDDRKRSLYREIFEALRPGGIFINLEHVASPTPWASRIFDDRFVDSLYARERESGSTRSKKEIADAYYYRDDKEANILAPVELQCEWLRAIGLEDVDCYFKLFELALFAGRRPN